MSKKKIIVLLALTVIAAVVAYPAFFLAGVWLRDGSVPLQNPSAGTNDASLMNPEKPSEVVAVASGPAEAERQLSILVRRAVAEHRHISISGADHSMGAHTIYPSAIVIDMLPFNRMSLDEQSHILTVGAGARLSQIIPYLDHRGYSLAIVQCDNDFSGGGQLFPHWQRALKGPPPLA